MKIVTIMSSFYYKYLLVTKKFTKMNGIDQHNQ